MQHHIHGKCKDRESRYAFFVDSLRPDTGECLARSQGMTLEMPQPAGLPDLIHQEILVPTLPPAGCTMRLRHRVRFGLT